jgi:hypothetical protein
MQDIRNPGTGGGIALSETQARQGRTGLGVRYVLIVSTTVAFAAMVLAYLFFWL